MIVVATAGASLAPQRPPSVKDVMHRVAAYVDAYGARASILVATEHYTQQSSTAATLTAAARTIVADFAIVKIDRLGWQGFRDVLEVDGQPLPDREDRLVRLLTDSTGGFAEARRLSDENARFNIGPIERNFNVPTTALFFFTADNLDRFTFAGKRVDPSGIWEIAFRETRRPTLIRTRDGYSVPCEGMLWVNPTDGTVIRTLMEVEGFARTECCKPKGTGRVDVTYERVPALDLWLPVAMDESFEIIVNKATRDSISGRALYSNYRQFTTSGRIK